jgi:hypothetical protein
MCWAGDGWGGSWCLVGQGLRGPFGHPITAGCGGSPARPLRGRARVNAWLASPARPHRGSRGRGAQMEEHKWDGTGAASSGPRGGPQKASTGGRRRRQGVERAGPGGVGPAHAGGAGAGREDKQARVGGSGRLGALQKGERLGCKMTGQGWWCVRGRAGRGPAATEAAAPCRAPAGAPRRCISEGAGEVQAGGAHEGTDGCVWGRELGAARPGRPRGRSRAAGGVPARGRPPRGAGGGGGGGENRGAPGPCQEGLGRRLARSKQAPGARRGGAVQA